MRKQPQKEPESLGTDLNIEGVRTEAQIVLLWTKHVLALCDGNKSVAAKVLGIDRRSLYRRLGYRYPSEEKRGSYGTHAEPKEMPPEDFSCS